ncbi:PepSY-associated TM helix domain-containing protein [Mucilaginibacter sp.]|uniref:PepSY-associated TM helix domain-containing protein n=1 Tax=Mucilaginibacter sp. TaxID=1882438 RepID=UPI00284BC955|nr:PepSY-associated TM helix domain-containing protein [Mucilaginibacter sp.]MDR3697679.1 PepSY-associated TM helix domain-containing protein [Mucilaginibacter sp.]
MKKIKLNRIMFSIHSWLGLFNGLWLLILGITGSLLVYTMELDKWINKDILTVQPAAHRLPYDSLYKIVRARYPNAMGVNIMGLPQEKTDCVSFRIYVEDGRKTMARWDEMFFMDINPYNGKILRQGSYNDIHSSFLFWSGEVHWNLNEGPIGTLIITIAGILLFINILTGIIIYRKYFFKALIFKAPVKWKNWRTGTSGLHRYIGIWSLVLNILIFYSGLQMTWGSLDKSYYQKPAPIIPITQKIANIDQMITLAQKIYPGFVIHYFYIPFSKTVINGTDLSQASAMGYIPGTPSIVPLSESTVNFNINTGAFESKVNANEELRKKNLWDKFNYIAYSFHAGTFLGQFSRILYVIVGLSPAFLAISGFMLWLRRKKIFKANNQLRA